MGNLLKVGLIPFHEDAVQINIRTEQEQIVAQKAMELYQALVALNMIHNGGTVFGDRRLKKNIKLEKVLDKYLFRKGK